MGGRGDVVMEIIQKREEKKKIHRRPRRQQQPIVRQKSDMGIWGLVFFFSFFPFLAVSVDDDDDDDDEKKEEETLRCSATCPVFRQRYLSVLLILILSSTHWMEGGRRRRNMRILLVKQCKSAGKKNSIFFFRTSVFLHLPPAPLFHVKLSKKLLLYIPKLLLHKLFAFARFKCSHNHGAAPFAFVMKSFSGAEKK